MFKRKINKENFILFDIPEGKINHQGDIVEQKPQKGPTCGFYSAKIVRQPRRFSQQTEVERAIEKKISSQRKQLTELYAQHLAEKTEVEQEQKQDALLSKMLKENNVPDQKFQNVTHKLNTLVFNHFVQFGFVEKKIKLDMMSIESLIKILDMYGPLIVLGRFGMVYYKKNVTPSKKEIEGMPFYFWKKEDRSPEYDEIIDRHFITIIGASQEDQYVYFVDSNDASSPENPRRVFIAQFDSFKEKLHLPIIIFKPPAKVQHEKEECDDSTEYSVGCNIL